MSLPIQATYRGRLVEVGRATANELAALAATAPLEEAIDTLERWSLIAIWGLEEGGAEVHALAWRRGLPNAWITSPLVAVDLANGAIKTLSGHIYGLGRPDEPGSLVPDLLYHLDYSLRRWGFADFRQTDHPN